MVTGGIFLKSHLLATRAHLIAVQDTMFEVLEHHGLELEAWAILSNHYHFVANGSESLDLSKVIGQFHRKSARLLNEIDNLPGRRVWYRSWDTQITYHPSYMARLHYVHRNPVRHGVVEVAEEYEFCSMGWLLRRGARPWVDSVLSFKTDTVTVYDDF
jgi:putative transposase